MQTRWETFLAKIGARHEELCVEAAAGFQAILRAHPLDSLALGRALDGVEHLLVEVTDRIEEVWDQEVDARFQALGDAAWRRAFDRKDDVRQHLDERWRTLRVRTQADLHRNARPLAERELARAVPCPGCGADLPRPAREPKSTVCPFCGAVNQLFPGPASSLYHGGGPRALAEERALPLRFAVERFRLEADRWRRDHDHAREPLESLVRWHDLELAYWTRFADVEAEVRGGARDPAITEGQMAAFRRLHLDNDQTWVNATRALAGSRS